MKYSRRNILAGLGSLAIGGGTLLSTGAFSSARADRTVRVTTASDANALLRLEPTPNSPNSGYVTETDGTIELNLDGTDTTGDGLNTNAVTRINQIVTLWNESSREIDDIRFRFEVDGATTVESQSAADIEEALQVTLFSFYYGPFIDGADGETNLLEDGIATDEDDSDSHDILKPDDRFDWGVRVDLGDDSPISDIEGNPDITLTIEAYVAD